MFLSSFPKILHKTRKYLILNLDDIYKHTNFAAENLTTSVPSQISLLSRSTKLALSTSTMPILAETLKLRQL
jgi:hypothetical protein